MDLEQKAIERMQKASEISMKLFGQPLVVTYSGGKDSDVILQIAKNAKVPFEVLHNHTTADAPETVYHIRNVFRELELEGIKCTIDKPVYKGKRTSMWNLIPQKLMPPTRLVRYCCAVLKEKGGTGRFIATGVRWDESVARKNNRGTMEVIHRDREKRLILQDDNDEARRTFETCKLKGKRVVNPIVEWKTDDVEFLFEHGADTICNLVCGGGCMAIDSFKETAAERCRRIILEKLRAPYKEKEHGQTIGADTEA